MRDSATSHELSFSLTSHRSLVSFATCCSSCQSKSFPSQLAHRTLYSYGGLEGFTCFVASRSRTLSDLFQFELAAQRILMCRFYFSERLDTHFHGSYSGWL